MFTYYLGREEVKAYLRELVQRLAKCDAVPTVWCPLTDSGLALVEPMMALVQEHAPEMAPLVSVLGIAVEKDGSISFSKGDPSKDLPGKHVLLFDASIHSGGSMLKAFREIKRFGAVEVCAYTLVLKRGSQFVPGLWGVMINDFDRAYFQLDFAPNNRLTTHLNEKHPYAHLRKLSEADVDNPPVLTEVASLDRATWGDRHYDMRESRDGKCTYLLEAKQGVMGYLTIHFDNNALHVDEVAVDKEQRKNGYGGVLMRFADTLTRHQDCWGVHLNAIKNKVGFYEKFGYKIMPGREVVRLETEEYVPMEKRLVHHVFPMDD